MVAGGFRAIKGSHFRFFPSQRFLLRPKPGRAQASCQTYQLASEEGLGVENLVSSNGIGLAMV